MTDLSKLTDVPSNSVAERVLWYGHDTIFFKGSGSNNNAVITKQNLFDPTITKNRALRTDTFPLTSGRVIRILGLRVTHNLKFKDPNDLVLFEEFAKITLNIENKDYTDLPIFDLLPYNRVNQGAKISYKELLSQVNQVASDPGTPGTNQIWFNTTTGLLKMNTSGGVIVIPDNVVENYNVLALNQKFKQLGNTIDPPHNGQITLAFDPVIQNKETDDITKFGYKFGGSLIDSNDSPVMWIKVSYVSEIIRPVK